MPYFSELGAGRSGEILDLGGPFGDLPDEERLFAIREALRSLGMRKTKVPPDLVKMLAAQGIGLGGIDRFIGDIQARQSLMEKSDTEIGETSEVDPAKLLEIQNILLYGSPRGGLRRI